MAPDDLILVHQIETLSTPFPWSPGQFKDSLAAHHCLVLEIDDVLVGFSIYSQVLDEFNLLDIAISPDYCQRGYGNYLLSAGLENCIKEQARQCYLEVRESNKSAIALYEKLDFMQIGLRKNYYPAIQGRENALIMSLIFD